MRTAALDTFSLHLRALEALVLLINQCGFITVNVNHVYDARSLFALLQKFRFNFVAQLS